MISILMVTYNHKFLEFAKNCLFTPIACKPYRPCTKGIVENLAKIMNRVKVYNEEFNDYEELKEIIRKLNETLNNEVSQATNEKCIDRFLNKEKEYLCQINYDQFCYKSRRQVRKVTNESLINFEANKYSVPVDYLGQLVEIEVEDNHLHIYYSGKEISTHMITGNKYNYHKNDLSDILHGIYPNIDSKSLNEMAERRLNGFDLRKRDTKDVK